MGDWRIESPQCGSPPRPAALCSWPFSSGTASGPWSLRRRPRTPHPTRAWMRSSPSGTEPRPAVRSACRAEGTRGAREGATAWPTSSTTSPITPTRSSRPARSRSSSPPPPSCCSRATASCRSTTRPGSTIPELPDYGEPLTIRHMLTHTSGLRDWGSVEAIAGWPRTTRVYTHAHVLDIVGRQKCAELRAGHQLVLQQHRLQPRRDHRLARLERQSFAEFSRRASSSRSA